MQKHGAVEGRSSIVFTSLWHILRQAGPMGLFKGYWATNCVWLPWNIVYIGCYEANKRAARSLLERTEQEALPAPAIMASAFAAAVLGAVVTHPADVIKTRLQVCLQSLAQHPCCRARLQLCSLESNQPMHVSWSFTIIALALPAHSAPATCSPRSHSHLVFHCY
jgi:hypothetical protein